MGYLPPPLFSLGYPFKEIIDFEKSQKIAIMDE